MLLRYLEGNDRDVSLHLALVRACLRLGNGHHVEAVEHARCAPRSHPVKHDVIRVFCS